MSTLNNSLTQIKDTYPALKLMEIRHRFTRGRTYHRMVQARTRFREAEDKKPESQIRKEMNLCRKYWRCYPAHYYRYDLFRQSKVLSEQELLDYIPSFFFYVIFLSLHNSKKYEILLADKTATEQYFRSLSINQPHTICNLVQQKICNERLMPIDFREIERDLAQKHVERIFVKPVEGSGGFGIYVFQRDESGQYLAVDGQVFNLEFLRAIGAHGNYLIQAGITQHAAVAKIYPHAVNTFRIITENISGRVRVVCAILRIGRAGRPFDNSSQDGLVAKIDLRTGRLGDHAGSEQCEHFTHHPDTGFEFNNYLIPQWNQILEFVTESAQKLYHFTYLGWDIALTENGPMAIEANLNFALDHCQVILGGIRSIFGIENPDIYWKNRKWTI